MTNRIYRIVFSMPGSVINNSLNVVSRTIEEAIHILKHQEGYEDITVLQWFDYDKAFISVEDNEPSKVVAAYTSLVLKPIPLEVTYIDISTIALLVPDDKLGARTLLTDLNGTLGFIREIDKIVNKAKVITLAVSKSKPDILKVRHPSYDSAYLYVTLSSALEGSYKFYVYDGRTNDSIPSIITATEGLMYTLHATDRDAVIPEPYGVYIA